MDIFLATQKFSFIKCDQIEFYLDVSKFFTEQIIDYNTHFHCCYNITGIITLPKAVPDFLGHSLDDAQIPYEWKIYKINDNLFIHIDFFENETIKEVLAVLNFSEKTILVELLPRSLTTKIKIDPFFHPLGSLLMVYLSHYSSGFLIHASGVSDNGNGYVFSGVSGKGKSTISQLWKQQGATVLNDDRLWIQKVDNEWKIFNTPMAYYSQEPKMATISKIFLITHSPENYVNNISGTTGALRVMSNCIQHLFDKKITDSHLDTLLEISEQIPIYKLGFKPTFEVVDFVRDI
ncbi:MAG: hypothetical protein FWH18_07360 [Marinilabiliaceae bacterium]|nr:hypothetical protein [Marinilabiliaceae bacterium]